MMSTPDTHPHWKDAQLQQQREQLLTARVLLQAVARSPQELRHRDGWSVRIDNVLLDAIRDFLADGRP